MVVIKECVSTAVSLQEKSSELFLCLSAWVTLFMFHLSLADVSWVKLNSWQWGGEITVCILFLCLGTGFLLAGLDPLIVCPAKLLVDNDKGRGWHKLFLSHRCQACWFESGYNILNWKYTKSMPLGHGSWTIIWKSMSSNTNHLSNIFSTSNTVELQVTAAPHTLQ